jgi:hypothetical protein
MLISLATEDTRGLVSESSSFHRSTSLGRHLAASSLKAGFTNGPHHSEPDVLALTAKQDLGLVSASVKSVRAAAQPTTVNSGIQSRKREPQARTRTCSSFESLGESTLPIASSKKSSALNMPLSCRTSAPWRSVSFIAWAPIREAQATISGERSVIVPMMMRCDGCSIR